MPSPTALSLRHYRAAGCLVDVVERWLPNAPRPGTKGGQGIHRDLFGIIDLVAIAIDEPILGIQATSLGNVSARVAKAQGSSALAVWLRTGARFVVIGWAKRDGRWVPKIVELRGPDIVAAVTTAIPRKRPPSRWQPADLLAGLET